MNGNDMIEEIRSHGVRHENIITVMGVNKKDYLRRLESNEWTTQQLLRLVNLRDDVIRLGTNALLCIYTHGVECYDHDCIDCGFNPTVAQKRKTIFRRKEGLK